MDEQSAERKWKWLAFITGLLWLPGLAIMAWASLTGRKGAAGDPSWKMFGAGEALAHLIWLGYLVRPVIMAALN